MKRWIFIASNVVTCKISTFFLRWHYLVGLNPPPPKLYKFSLSLDIDILISTQSTLEIHTSFLMKTTVWLLFWYRGGGTCRTPPPHAAGPDVLPVLYLCSGPSHHPPAGGWRRGWRRSVRQWGRGEGHLELYGGGPRALPQAFPGETHTQGQTGKKKKKDLLSPAFLISILSLGSEVFLYLKIMHK